MNENLYDTKHPVTTIDRSQVTSLNCVYLYNTEKRESGWNNSFATANALRVLKDQVQVAGGNAIVIRDIYSSKDPKFLLIHSLFFKSSKLKLGILILFFFAKSIIVSMRRLPSR